MSSQSNVITKLKGFLHDAGANTADSAAAVDSSMYEHIALNVGPGLDDTNTNFANGHVVFSPAVDRKLVAVKWVSPLAHTNVAGDTIIITVVTNGATVVTYNTDSYDNAAANTTTDLGINTANSFCNANTITSIAWTQEDAPNNTLKGSTFVLVLKPI